MDTHINFDNLFSEMEKIILPHIVDRGYDYYQRGMVKKIEINTPWVYAIVLGNYSNYNVKVHMKEFTRSSCNCPYDYYCKHIAAVVFTLFDKSKRNTIFIEDSGQAPTDKPDTELLQTLRSMGKEDLLAVWERLMEMNASIQETTRLILAENTRLQALKSGKVAKQGLFTSLAYYQKEIPEVLMECESLFVKNEVEAYYSYGYEYGYGYDDDEEDTSEWDFEAGLDRLCRYGQQLLHMVTPEHYISGAVGLMILVKELEEWTDKYEEAYNSDDIVDGCYKIEVLFAEAVERVITYTVSNQKAELFLKELLDWIIQECKTLEDLLEWTFVLSQCVANSRHLWYLKKSIKAGADRDFLRSLNFTEERYRNVLVYWWVELSLSLELEEEAEEAALSLGETPYSNDSIAYLFVRYYEQKGKPGKAKEILESVLNRIERIAEGYFKWIISLCEKVDDYTGKKKWSEKWFLTYPSLDLFKENWALAGESKDKDKKLVEWTNILREQGRYYLLMDIYLYLENWEKAWDEFIHNKNQIFISNEVVNKLFRKIIKHDPARLIPVYRGLVLDNINLRKRPAYKTAAKWMKNLKEVCHLSGQDAVWATFYTQIMYEYKRFRALMEEIRTAGL